MTESLLAVPAWQFELAVDADADQAATEDQTALLAKHPLRWRSTLHRMVRDAEDHLAEARRTTGDHREQVLADLHEDLLRLSGAFARLTGEPEPEEILFVGTPADGAHGSGQSAGAERSSDDDDGEPGQLQLQVSWDPGRVIAWGAGPRTPTADHELVEAMLATAGAPTGSWTKHGSVKLPSGATADALAIPVGEVLGWLVAAGADQADVDEPVEGDDTGAASLGASVRWLGRLAIWAVELVASGSVIPLLRQRKRGRQGGAEGTASYSVRWMPALLDPVRVKQLAADAPGSVLVLDQSNDPASVVKSALTGMVDAICRDAARRIEVPAPPPVVRTSNDVAESYLARLDGSPFDAPMRIGGGVIAGLERWSRSVTNSNPRLIVQLDPPDAGNAWHLSVLAPGPGGAPMAVEEAMAQPGAKPRDIEDQINRVERLVPALLRPGGMRRGLVILSQDEAWELMSSTGPQLANAGFDVRVPLLSKKRATPSLRVFAEGSNSVAGANQLADVRWSALFDDVELSAEDIRRLAREARPLIRSGGKWVALDKADLEAAAEALAERESTTQMTGGEMLRLALGLDGSSLAGGVSIGGQAWAAELLAKASEVSTEPAPEPDGFAGELRHYQSEALAWLGFLDSVGLGGCLALDMGLGKTPTLLAHLLVGAANGPSLVVAPPAVVGNWANESRRFAKGLKVLVHHGAGRADSTLLAKRVAKADLVITTYGTAVRDIEALETIEWNRLVLDEAQAIKNPANDTSQQLRRLGARTRIALTGTPIENGLGDLWAILDFTNPGLVGTRPAFIAQLSRDENSTRVEAEDAMRALNGILVFRRTKSEPAIAAELPDRIDQLDHCAMTPEQVGLYQAVLDTLVTGTATELGEAPKQGAILAAITALKQICNHPAAYQDDDRGLPGRSGKLARLEEIVDAVFASGERVLVFTHFAQWGVKLAAHLTKRMDTPVECYHGGLSRGHRDRIIEEFQKLEGPGVLVLSLKAGGTGLNLTAASHVVLYDRWWNPAVEDQARDRAWRIGQTRTVICHRLICPGTVDERVEEVVAGKRRIADMVLPKSSSLADLDTDQLRMALGLRPDEVLMGDLTADDQELVTT